LQKIIINIDQIIAIIQNKIGHTDGYTSDNETVSTTLINDSISVSDVNIPSSMYAQNDIPTDGSQI